MLQAHGLLLLLSGWMSIDFFIPFFPLKEYTYISHYFLWTDIYLQCFFIFLLLYNFDNLHRYPNPSAFTYERRLFCPFEYALQPPSSYKPEQIAINKPELPYGVSELKKYKGPQCFIIPGNHGW